MGTVAHRDDERGDDAGVARHHEISRRVVRHPSDRVHGHAVRGDGAAARRGEAARQPGEERGRADEGEVGPVGIDDRAGGLEERRDEEQLRALVREPIGDPAARRREEEAAEGADGAGEGQRGLRGVGDVVAEQGEAVLADLVLELTASNEPRVSAVGKQTDRSRLRGKVDTWPSYARPKPSSGSQSYPAPRLLFPPPSYPRLRLPSK